MLKTYVIEFFGQYLKFDYESAENFKEDVKKIATQLKKKYHNDYDETFEDGCFCLAGIHFHYSSVLCGGFESAKIITLEEFLVEFFSENIYDKGGYDAAKSYLSTNHLGYDL